MFNLYSRRRYKVKDDKKKKKTKKLWKNVKELMILGAGFGIIILRLSTSMPYFDFCYS